MRCSIWLMACLVVVLTGCASRSIYYWGDYSDTLYQYKKSPSDKTFARHKKELEKVIDQSAQRGKLVPPGLYFELAMLEIKQGNVERGKALMRREMETYPESSQMVTKAMALIGD